MKKYYLRHACGRWDLSVKGGRVIGKFDTKEDAMRAFFRISSSTSLSVQVRNLDGQTEDITSPCPEAAIIAQGIPAGSP